MQLDPGKAALIVVDMQKSFCKPEGKVPEIGLDTSACQAVIAPCADVLAIAREAGMPVIFTRYIYESDYADGGVLVEQIMPELAQVAALRRGTDDVEIVPELAVRDSDTVIDKNRPSAFYKTRLDDVLTGLGREQLVVCGVTTNCCVESTVRDASHRDLEVFVVGDACAELDEERHRVSLMSMGMLFADVIDIDGLRRAAAA